MHRAAAICKNAEVDPESAAAAIPQVQVVPTPATGKRGPVGTAPRTNYSRVNTGTPDTPDAGGISQKSMEPKVARVCNQFMSEVSMNTMAARPTLQQMLKNAMAGASIGSTKIAEEANRQLENLEGGSSNAEERTDEPEEKVSGAYARKLASAVEYCAEILKTGADLAGPWNLTESKVEPGKGPGALKVMESPDGPPISENSGQARRQPPVTPKLQKQLASGTDAATQIENDIDRRPGAGSEASWAPMGDQSKLSMVASIRKTAGGVGNYMVGGLPGVYLGELAREAGTSEDAAALHPQLTGLAGMGVGVLAGAGLGALIGRTAPAMGAMVGGLAGAGIGGLGGGIAGFVKKRNELNKLIAEKKALNKESSVAAIRKIAASYKTAEDATSPSHISAGPAKAPQTIEASTPGPGGKNKETVPTTPQSVAAFKRRDAKANVKAEMKQYLNEPMMSSESDKVLENAFSHTGEAGAKISSVQEVDKVASARNLMRQLAESAGVNPAAYQ